MHSVFREMGLNDDSSAAEIFHTPQLIAFPYRKCRPQRSQEYNGDLGRQCNPLQIEGGAVTELALIF